MLSCGIEDCGKPVQVKKYNLCGSHYKKLRRHGDASVSKRAPSKVPCSVPGCTLKSVGKSLCVKHYWRWKRYGDPTVVKSRPGRSSDLVCSARECSSPVVARKLCSLHYKRWQVHGDPEYTSVISTCKEVGCEQPHEALGYCSKHYYAYKMKTDPGFVEAKRARWHRWISKPEVKQRQRLKRRETYSENLEIFREKCRSYYKSHKAALSQNAKVRRSLPHNRYLAGLRAAHDTARNWFIEVEDYVALLDRPCHYCGVHSNTEAGYWLDRKDPSGDYSLSNVVPCCGTCNRLKNSLLSEDEMISVVKLLQTLRGKTHVWI